MQTRRPRASRARVLLLLVMTAMSTGCGDQADLREIACSSAPLVKIGTAAAQCGLVNSAQAIVLPLRQEGTGAILLVLEDNPAGEWTCADLGIRLIPSPDDADVRELLPQAAKAIESTQDTSCRGD